MRWALDVGELDVGEWGDGEWGGGEDRWLDDDKAIPSWEKFGKRCEHDPHES